MKNISTFISFLTMLLPLQATDITLVADEWCPFNCAQNAENKGYIIEIAAKIFEKHGHKLIYENIPWARATAMTRNGRFDGVIGAFKEDAPDFIFPTKEIGRTRNCFYKRQKKKWHYEDLQSLKNQKIGVINSYSYGPLFDNYVASNINTKNIVKISGTSDVVPRIIKMLMKDRLDLIIESEIAMRYHLKTRANTIVNAGCIGPKEKIYIAFSPKNNKSKKYSKMLSQGIESMSRSGELTKILSKYGVTSWR